MSADLSVSTIRLVVRSLLWALLFNLSSSAFAQEMEPRAYSRAPVGSQFVVFLYAHQTGDVLLDSALPLRDVSVKLNATTVAYGRTFALAGKQANLSIAWPYVWGRASGTVFEEHQEVTRSG